MDHFECLYAESAERAKIMAIAVHPYLSGVPHRIGTSSAPSRKSCRTAACVACWSGEKILDWYLGTHRTVTRRDPTNATQSLSLAAFVPHDLKAPLEGAAQRAARRPHRRGQGHVRHRRRAHRRRQSGLARHA